MTAVFPIIVVAMVIGAVVALKVSLRRFEQRKIQNGEWDENGPKNPTPAPPNFYPQVLSGTRAFDALSEAATGAPDVPELTDDPDDDDDPRTQLK